MYDNYNYPLGADNPNAPWNQEENPEREIEVTVSVTLSKTVKVKVSDYECNYKFEIMKVLKIYSKIKRVLQ